MRRQRCQISVTRLAVLLTGGGLVFAGCGRHEESPRPQAPAKASGILAGSDRGGGLLVQVRPKYPDWARRQKIEGVVHLNVLVGKDGWVKHVEPAGGPEPLIPFAVDAVTQWRYRPAMIKGEPVEVRMQVDLSFTLRQ